MKKIIFVLIMFAVILITAVSCSTSKDVTVKERRTDNGVVIKKKKEIKDGDNKDVKVRVRKERRDRDKDDEPAIIIDKNR
ncbi:MAG: hypothetical protein ACM3NR_01705 [Methanosarcina sp.]